MSTGNPRGAGRKPASASGAKVPVGMKVPPDAKAMIKAGAERDGVTQQVWLEQAIREKYST